jgi:hypothetical protein
MKNFISALCLSSGILLTTAATAQTKQLYKLWETEATLKVPESVLYDAQSKTLYFSNIDGKPNEKDKIGSIGKLGSDGKNLTVEWVKGLSAPKGLGLYKGILYVADIDEVVGIDVKSSKIVEHIPVEGAIFLNDITIDNKGVIYVSDMHKGNIHRIENGKVSTYLNNHLGVNGLLSVDDDLYFVQHSILWKADKNKNLTKVAEGMDVSTDGIEQTNDKNFIVSCWPGVIFYVKDGTPYRILDTQEQKSNTADIGFDKETSTVFVPTFFANKIVAYQLK